MNAPTTAIHLPEIGQPFEGGFFAGLISIDKRPFALVRAPKAAGQHNDVCWHEDYRRIEGALSFCDGLSNTNAMAEAGSKIAQWAREQHIAGFDDWHIPAMDALEICYRHLKPTAASNSLWGRSGLNVSAVPSTYPYSAELPTQTLVDAFREGDAEAFDPVWYWSSTQPAGDDDYAWCQGFRDGYQYASHKDDQCRVVLVRSIPL